MIDSKVSSSAPAVEFDVVATVAVYPCIVALGVNVVAPFGVAPFAIR